VAGSSTARQPAAVWRYIVGTYDNDAGPENQRLYLNGARVAQVSDTQPIDLNSASSGIGRHVSGLAHPFNGHIEEFRISHVQRTDGWIATMAAARRAGRRGWRLGSLAPAMEHSSLAKPPGNKDTSLS